MSLRLQKDGVHLHLGFPPGGGGLHGLGSPHLLPPDVTKEFRAMFWALKGATRSPLRAKMRHRAAVRTLFPTDEDVPWIISVRARIGHSPDHVDSGRVPCYPRSPFLQGEKKSLNIPTEAGRPRSSVGKSGAPFSFFHTGTGQRAQATPSAACASETAASFHT
jgi:hypothetical protein